MEFAGTATLLFAVLNAVKIVPYQLLQPYSMNDLHQASALIPAALLVDHGAGAPHGHL